MFAGCSQQSPVSGWQDMARILTNNWTFVILVSWSVTTHQDKHKETESPPESQFDGHGFMVNVLVGVIVIIFGLMVMLVICINNTCIKRYLAARQLVMKAAQYRPAKYKKVSPTSSASVQGKHIIRVLQ